MEEQLKLSIDYNIQIAKEIEAIAGAYWRMAQLDIDMAGRQPRGSLNRTMYLNAASRHQAMASVRYMQSRRTKELLRRDIMVERSRTGGKSDA